MIDHAEELIRQLITDISSDKPELVSEAGLCYLIKVLNLSLA
jgi:hypothetical protein